MTRSLSDDPAVVREHVALFDRDDVGWIELVGPEATFFLNNLATQDIRSLAEGTGRETFLTTNKARVVGHGVVERIRRDAGDVLRLQVEACRADAVLKHLNHHLISEQVELGNRSDDLAMLSLVGHDAAGFLGGIIGQTCDERTAWSHREIRAPWGFPCHLRRQGALAVPGFDLILPRDRKEEVKAFLRNQGAALSGMEVWEILRIESGWPRWGHELDENRFVVEVGRSAQAISYTKGCYLGQEPIVMARDRGQVNRQLLGIRVSGPLPVPTGARLLLGEAEVGQVTSSAPVPNRGDRVGLAYLRRGHQEAGTTLTIADDPAGRAAIVSSLPMATS